MSFAAEALRDGKRPVVVVEIDLDWVTSPVAAFNPDGSPCYRTPTTCRGQEPLTLGTRTRRFVTETGPAIPNLDAIPCLRSVSEQHEELRLGEGLGSFGQATATLRDFADDDRVEDPFITTRTHDTARGSYYTKLFARNPVLTGRAMRVLEGYLDADGRFDPANFRTASYLIKEAAGPKDGAVRIVGVGPLQLLNLTQAKAPVASRGVLPADLPAGATSFSLESAAVADDYDAAGHLNVNDEIMGFARTGTSFALTRGAFGTDAADHRSGDSVQQCLVFEQEKPYLIIDRLLREGGVDPAFIDLPAWAADHDTWLRLWELEAVLPKPADLVKLVREICEVVGYFLWWDAEAAKLQLRLLRPVLEAAIAELDDDAHLLTPVETVRDVSKRVSRADVAFNLRSPVANPNELRSYRTRIFGKSQSIGPGLFKEEQPRLVLTRFLDGQEALALRASWTIANQLRDGRVTYRFELSAKDAGLGLGDVVRIRSRDLVDETGAPRPTLAMVVRREPIQRGHSYRYVAERFIFDARFAFMTDAPFPDYVAASPAQRDPGAFMGSVPDNRMPGGDAGYVMG